MFERKFILLMSITLLFWANFAFSLPALAISATGINTQSKTLPSVGLTKPLRSKGSIITSKVYAALIDNQPPDVLSKPQSQKVPPLGMLIIPLPDQNSSSQASFVPNAPQVHPFLANKPTTQESLEENKSPARPLGLLMDQSTFTPRVQAFENRALQKTKQKKIAPKHQFLTPQWNQQGKSADRPLGTLLIPGSFNPMQHQIASTKLFTRTPGLNDHTPEIPYVAPADTMNEPPVDFSADEMSFDRENGIVSARGNVEIRYKERRLNADIVSYNRETNVVLAEGNVVIVEPTQETIFGEKVEITDDLRNGFILNIGVILKDRARIVGSSATHMNANRTEINNAVYSPCDLCKKNPNKPPFWQIKAIKIINDKAKQTIDYRDAWIEFFGFPVFYTPYFRHPDPTVKRKSGFLFPIFRNSTDMGTTLVTPYFLNISPSEDATISPIITTKSAPILSAEYRNRMNSGMLDIEGSLTKNSEGASDLSTEKGHFGLRGHTSIKGRFDANNFWRWGFDGNGATDDTYMRRYEFGDASSLKSEIFAEAFKNRSYFSAKMQSFQSLQEGMSSGAIPLILPLVDFNLVSKKDRFGGSTNFDLNLLSLDRDNGTDTRRLSARSMWQRPLVGPLGDIYNISFGLNTDIYHVNELNRGGKKSKYTGFSRRLRPEAAFEWRLPFAKSDGSTSYVIEPISSFMWSPYGGNSNKAPNEDSIEMEFDDTNLFRLNRFSGIDRVEGGPRLVYGLKWGSFKKTGGKSNVFIGQSFRPKTDDTYATGSGLENKFSDIVTRMEISPGPHLNATYRSRIDADDFSPKRNEIGLSAGIAAFRVSGSYVYMESQTDSEFNSREELNLTATSQIDRYWRSGFNATNDMDASEFRRAGMYLTYEDECVVFTTKVNRSFFSDRDLKPTDSITFSLILKTIGEIRTDGYVIQ